MKPLSKSFTIMVVALSIGHALQAGETNKYEKSLAEWYQQNDPASSARPAWSDPAFDASKWKQMDLPTPWEIAGLPDYDGVVWFRKEIDLPESWAGKNAVLDLGVIDDHDTTWINGVQVGARYKYNDMREYSVPATLLKTGRNVIVVRVLDTGGPGGIDGDPEQMQLKIPADNRFTPVSLAGAWQYRDSIPLSKAQPLPANPADIQPAGHNFEQWETEITAFETRDRTNPPPQNAVLFIGSSTIRMWTTLEIDFPGQPVINRGFGGSEILDSTHFAGRILFPYSPRAIFFRAGGNDIAAGKSPEAVFEDFKDFVATVHAKLPDVEIFYISWNPTIARWQNRDKEKILNDRVKEYAHQTPHLKYIETGDIVLGADGKPRPELFRADKLHFNADGYKLLAERIRPSLPK